MVNEHVHPVFKKVLDTFAKPYVPDKDRYPDCPICQLEIEMKPRHDGSKNCQSGSIASGGDNAHCSCDTCF